MTTTLQIELNEVNFDYVRRYVSKGYLPTFGRLIAEHGVTETVSEARYEWLEPWIQWVTAHTGLSFEEHQVFRLGDIVRRTDVQQVWEMLERKGLSVAAVSPMNAHNAVSERALFVPDPWTDTAVSGSRLIKNISAALRQAVNDNATQRLSTRSALHLVAGVVALCKPGELLDLVKLAAGAKFGGWRKAIFLDVFLSALYLNEWEKRRPHFSTLFLNAGAHIQHHYMFSSSVYEGGNKNPEWYIKKGADPLLEIYSAYDSILARVLKRAKGQRVIVATGLHQDAEGTPIYYWRPIEHARLLRRMGIVFKSVQPRMSRDFLIVFESDADSAEAKRKLLSARLNDESVFSVDDRGRELFVELIYPHELKKGSYLTGDIANGDIDLFEETAFVAIKNGRHNGIGYLIDTSVTADECRKQIPLKDLPGLVTVP